MIIHYLVSLTRTKKKQEDEKKNPSSFLLLLSLLFILLKLTSLKIKEIFSSLSHPFFSPSLDKRLTESRQSMQIISRKMSTMKQRICRLVKADMYSAMSEREREREREKEKKTKRKNLSDQRIDLTIKDIDELHTGKTKPALNCS